MMRMRLDTSDFKAGLAALGSKMPGVARRALKRAGTSGRAEMAKRISEDTALGVGKVKKSIELKIESDTAVSLTCEGPRVPLIEFSARGKEPSLGKGSGVTYRLPTGRGKAEHAFIPTMRSGHRGVFQRKAGAPRLPITELEGPSLVKVFDKYVPEAQEKAQESLAKNLRSEISFALSRR